VGDEARIAAKDTRDHMLEDARRDIEQETRRSIGQIRREVADLTVLATEKVARKSLTPEDHERLIQDALQEFDFSRLPGVEDDGGANGSQN
jgi:F-type H+-transporting ATPase subunit b